jgi:hypothetical protein
MQDGVPPAADSPKLPTASPKSGPWFEWLSVAVLGVAAFGVLWVGAFVALAVFIIAVVILAPSRRQSARLLSRAVVLAILTYVLMLIGITVAVFGLGWH